ncbi:MAG TPA: OprO/OprP family phosphate-selective porin [Candidatus Coprenecus stercoravium]|uniref:OprO/OprP family phosphate-selective porin n=1 Tax=Candidatus Coprenecus stercoravium TaxID=2840735 RepID=A0A9D2GQ69_9BACT|nr:OprO/OprP family phosphate-selective porin [Candidatus Coprenecus stercoravium]
MRRLCLLIFCAAAVLSPLRASDKLSLTDTLLEGKVSQTFMDNHDMAFQMRGSLRAEIPEGGDASARFRMDNFRWNMEGTFGRNKALYYHFRQSFNANFRTNTFDNLLESVDYAYMMWTPVKAFSLTFGKQVMALGGQEAWAAPVYVIQYSDFGGSFPCYQLGVMGTWHISPTQDLAFQVSNIRGLWDDEYFYGGLPDGVESSKAPFLYTLNWNGNFFNDALEFRWSASYGSQAGKKDLWIVELGQSYRSRWWGVYLDLIYSRQDLDANGIISRAAVFSDGVLRTMENVEYFSAIGYLHLFLSPSFSAFLKGSIEHGSLFRPYGDIPDGLCRSSWNAQACLEYMPTKSRDFRFFLHYNYYNASPAGSGSLLGILPTREHRVTLGLIYIMNIY